MAIRNAVALLVVLVAVTSAHSVSNTGSGGVCFGVYNFVYDLDTNRDLVVSEAELTAFANSITPGANPVLRCQFVTKFVNTYGLSLPDANNLYDILAKGDRSFSNSDWQGEGGIPTYEFRTGFQKLVSQASQVTTDFQRLLDLTRQYWDQKTIMEARARGFDASVYTLGH